MSVQNRKITEAAPSDSWAGGRGGGAPLYQCTNQGDTDTNHLEIVKKARILPHRWAQGIKLRKKYGNGRSYVFSKYEYLVKILQYGY